MPFVIYEKQIKPDAFLMKSLCFTVMFPSLPGHLSRKLRRKPQRGAMRCGRGRCRR